MNLLLDKHTADYLVQHAKETYPDECCGFLFGDDSDGRTITHAYRVTNAKEGDKRQRFQIAPDDYRRAEQFALNKNMDLLGVYHSHPDHPAEPSVHDRSVAMPYFSYIIVSVRDGMKAGMRSWRLDEKRNFEEEMIEINKYSTENATNV